MFKIGPEARNHNLQGFALHPSTLYFIFISRRKLDVFFRHILFQDDDFFDETIKTLYEEESVQTCLRANQTILKDDEKFRKMFAKVKSTGHKWWDANTCNKLTCSICKRRF